MTTNLIHCPTFNCGREFSQPCATSICNVRTGDCTWKNQLQILKRKRLHYLATWPTRCLDCLKHFPKRFSFLFRYLRSDMVNEIEDESVTQLAGQVVNCDCGRSSRLVVKFSLTFKGVVVVADGSFSVVQFELSFPVWSLVIHGQFESQPKWSLTNLPLLSTDHSEVN